MKAADLISRSIARHLLEIEAVALRPTKPFTWSSGAKSPIYCDNRLTISYPHIRKAIAEGFASIIREQYPDTEVIAGAATGGIPHAAFVAQLLDLPMIYVRDKAKGHGKQNLIEGVLKPGQKAVVIEDLISTGGSSLKAALAVRDAEAEPMAVLAIFSYQLAKADELFQEAGIPFSTLSNYSALVEEALAQGKISESDLSLLSAWRENPLGWGE